MKIINLEKLQIRKKSSFPFLTARQALISINKEALNAYFPNQEHNENTKCYIELAQDEENQLHIRISLEPLQHGVMLKAKKSGRNRMCNEWISHGKAMADFLKDLTGCNNKSVPCRIQTNAKNIEGWSPVITSYWKSKMKDE